MSRLPKITTNEKPSFEIDTNRPSIARVYDYLLGGKDNFAVDRELGDRIKTGLPEVHIGVQQQRALLRRVVRYLIGEVGLRQLIDIGTGLPTADNVHEVAHALDPGARVVYVDNDPIVLTHARALLADNTNTIVIRGDMREPEAILDDPDVRSHIDFSEPVGLLLCGILHYLTDDEDPAGVISRLMAGLAPDSHLFIHHLVTTGDDAGAALEATLRQGVGSAEFRRTEEIERFFAGTELVAPGVVAVPEWRPDHDTLSVKDYPVLRLALAGVARKP
jgi:hypothetical protein